MASFSSRQTVHFGNLYCSSHPPDEEWISQWHSAMYNYDATLRKYIPERGQRQVPAHDQTHASTIGDDFQLNDLGMASEQQSLSEVVSDAVSP